MNDNNNPRDFAKNIENMMNNLNKANNNANNNGNINNLGMNNMGMNNMGMNNMGMNNIGMNNMGMNNMGMNNMGMNNMGMNNMGMNMGMNNMGYMNMNPMMGNYMMMNNEYMNYKNNFPPNMQFVPNIPNMGFQNYQMQVQNNNMKVLNVHYNNEVKKIEISANCKIEDFITVIKKQFKINVFFKLNRQGKPLSNKLTVAECGLDNGDNIFVIFPEQRFDDRDGYIKPINITFHLDKFNNINSAQNVDLTGISKTCYLKEISSKLSDQDLNNFPEDIKCILLLLKKSKITGVDKLKDETKELLERFRKTNVLNFTNFVDKTIDNTHIKKMLELMDKNDLNNLQEFKNHLSKLNPKIIMFDKEFITARRKSVFEYSLVSLKIEKRLDINDYIQAYQNCPDKNERILYFGISDDVIPKILQNNIKPSSKGKFGNGYYLTNSLDFACIMQRDSEDNELTFPSINEVFDFVASSVFYNNKTRKRVKDNSYSPQKNEANVVLVDGKMNSLNQVDKSKFFSREYVLGDNCQIMPFIHVKVKRNEYCVIWRDPNLSAEDVYGDSFDKIFKDFLKERLDFISKFSKFNIYPCVTSKEALELVKKKKFNKIILISNVGSDYGGRDFVNEARKIIGNDVLAFFNAYMEEHLEWIVNYKNALFSNDKKFYEQYLECFTDDLNTTKKNILTLKSSIEDNYDVKFKIEDDFLNYPHFKEEGKFADLNF